MKRAISLALCAMLAIVCLSGCVAVNLSYFNAAVGVGNLETYTVDAGEITEIRVELFCDVKCYAAASETVKFEIQPNLWEYIAIEESGGVLTVRSTRNITWSDKTPVLTVSTPALERVSLAGAGNFTALDTIAGDSLAFRLDGASSVSAELDVAKLSVNMSGAGDINFSGKADTADFDLSGAGRLDALRLQTRKASVGLAGVGTVRVNCSESLRIDAGGLGTVEYKGSPSIDLSKGGLVSVKKLD